MASLSGVVLQVGRVDKPVLDYLKFMAGREVRAKVLQGGQGKEPATLRLGGRVVYARVQGQALRTGADLYVRVERQGKNSYRLVVLTDGAGASSAPGIAQAAQIPPRVQELFTQFLGRTLGGKRTRDQKNRMSSAPEKARNTSLSSLKNTSLEGPADPESLEEKLNELLGRLERGPRETLERALGFPGKGMGARVLLMEGEADTEQGERGNSDAGPERDQSAPRGDSNSSGGAAQPTRREFSNLVTGFGDPDHSPGYYFMQFELDRLGQVGVLFLASDPEFENFSVFLSALAPATERLFEGLVLEWSQYLNKKAPGIVQLAVLPRSPRPEGPEIDFRA